MSAQGVETRGMPHERRSGAALVFPAMRAVVVAHGDVLPSDRAVIGAQDYVVAADGGALALERWRVLPHLVVGDMESLGDAGVERFAPQGIPVAKFPAAKNESD